MRNWLNNKSCQLFNRFNHNYGSNSSPLGLHLVYTKQQDAHDSVLNTCAVSQGKLEPGHISSER